MCQSQVSSPQGSSLNSYSSSTGDTVRQVLRNDDIPRHVPTIMRGDWVIDQDTKEGDDIEKRKSNMRRAYDDEVKMKLDANSLRTLKSILRREIIPMVKFVPESNSFGAFEKPDFSSPECWQNKLFEKMPKLMEQGDTYKVKYWMTYKSHLKTEFANVRGIVNKKIKAVFMNSK